MEALILADDLTGADATAALCARAGQPALTVFDLSLLGGRLAPVTVIDTETRALTPAAAERTVRRILGRVDLAAPRFVGLRIDSTLRGNWGAEIGAWLASRAAPDLVVVTPAYPDAGRRCEGGVLTVHGRPLREATAGLPGAPKSSSVVEILFDQLPIALTPVLLPLVRQGPAGLAAYLADLQHLGSRVVICDATETADIETIAAAIAQLPLRIAPVDPGPVMSRLLSNQTLPPPGEPVGPPVVVYAGTMSALGAAEVAEIATRRPLEVVEIDPDGSVEAAERRAGQQVTTALQRGSDLIAVRPAPTDPTPARQRAFDRAYAAIARRVQVTAARPPRGLVLTGGATALAVARGLGGRGLLVEREVRPLVARGRLVGGPSSGLPVVTKGGLVPGLADAIAELLGA